MALLLALLLAAEAPGLKDLFDPFSEEFPADGSRPAAKERALGAWLAGGGAPRLVALLGALEGGEKALARVDERTARQVEVHAEALRKFEAARDAYARKYRREHGRDPAEWPRDPSVDRAILAEELRLKECRARRLHEWMFQSAAFEAALRALAALPEAERAPCVDALAAGLRSANRRQRLRCFDLLVAAGRRDVAAGAAEAERDPAFQGVLLRAVDDPGPLGRALGAPAWQVRAGAFAALGRIGTPEARRLVEAAQVSGRLVYDRLRALGSGGPPPPEPPPFGVPTSSERQVFAIDVSLASAAILPSVVEQLMHALDALPERGVFGLVCFAETAKPWRNAVVPASAANRRAAAAELGKRTPAGAGADVHGAFLAALELCRAGDADTIVYVSAAEPEAGLAIHPQMIGAEIAALARLSGVAIHTVGRSTEKHREYLQQISRESGGIHVPIG